MSNGPIIPDVVSASPDKFPINGGLEDNISPTIHRAASHTLLGGVSASKARPERANSLHRSFSENLLANTARNISRKDTIQQDTEGPVRTRKSLRRLGSTKRGSIQRESRAQYTVSKFIVGAEETSQEIACEPATGNDGRAPNRGLKTHSVSGSITNFAKKSWPTASRSPSPSPSKRRSRRDVEVAPEPDNPSTKLTETSSDSPIGTVNGVLRRNSILSKRARRPLSSLLSKGHDNPNAPSVPPIPKSFSTDKLPSLDHKSPALSHPPNLPRSRSFERFHSTGSETPRKKDELWGVFRNLDGEYQKFHSRPGTLRTGIVRSALLPFLRSYAEHPSILLIKPEDLDRRTVILNKWWTGLLEMLNGRHGESVSGNDRPAVLEAVTALMVRPEWTLPFSAFSHRPNKTPRASLKSRSTTSLGSTMTMASDFLVESVYHNMRNTFTQNLLAQMAYVVDKMSMRNVAASVVAFCGKATAYAFFYCEGIAEILVRLWATPTNTLRRVLAENEIEQNTNLDSVSDRVCASFPPCIQHLTFRSLPSMTRYLRRRPHVPLATSYIPWHGPWIGRWAGKDTDLFYVFTKFYTELSCRFLPQDPSKEEKVTAPSWLLVQAQILSMLDATMQKLNVQPPGEQSGPSSITFDDMLKEADANATVLPLPANGAARSMAENRLILLLRDCLSGSTIMTEGTQSVFAQSFSTMLKATARKISVFDHNACFTLCDFLEEAFAILSRYREASGTMVIVIDWAFWLNVCKYMLQSHNSMTEVRLCAFLYSMWPTITSDAGRKRQLCIEWLLSEEIFQTQFNHWCPMVRAFFMRLLAWRVARVDGNNPVLDKCILETMAERLQESWCHFLYLQEAAGKTSMAAPCSPAPGRRLLIIRNDVQPAPAGMFLSFDGILSSSASIVNPYEKHSSINLSPRSSSGQLARSGEGHSLSSNGGKKRWALIKNIIPRSSTPRDHSESTASGRQADGVDGSPMSPQVPFERSKTSGGQRTGPGPNYRSLSFKFSLEWFDRDGNHSGLERRLSPPKLPPHAYIALEPHRAESRNDTALKPQGAASGPSKYAGRALAEWALLIVEYRNFFERRKAEGVPTYQLVETPTLGVEPFRKI